MKYAWKRLAAKIEKSTERLAIRNDRTLLDYLALARHGQYRIRLLAGQFMTMYEGIYHSYDQW
jgi:hypothetical protein